MNGQALGLEVGYRRATGTVVHLFDGPFVTIEGQRFDVPEGSKDMVAHSVKLGVASATKSGAPATAAH